MVGGATERPGVDRAEGCGHGLHRQRPGGEPRGGHRHQPAGDRRAARAPVYVDGEKARTLEGPTLAEDFIAMVEEYVEAHYPRAGAAAAAAQ